MFNEYITLLEEIIGTDNIGDPIVSTVERDVFVEVKSIGQSEFYQAQAKGLKPEIKFIIADYYDYHDEKKLIYNEQIYNVLRTYRNGIQLEITGYRGVNNGST